MALHELPDNRSLPELLTDLVRQLTSLTQKELAIARTEVNEKLNQAMLAGAMLLFAAVIMIPALVILLQAAVRGVMASGLYAGWASFAIGGFVFLVGLVAAFIGYRRLSLQTLKPEKTIEQLREDAAMAKEQVNHGKHRAA